MDKHVHSVCVEAPKDDFSFLLCKKYCSKHVSYWGFALGRSRSLMRLWWLGRLGRVDMAARFLEIYF